MQIKSATPRRKEEGTKARKRSPAKKSVSKASKRRSRSPSRVPHGEAMLDPRHEDINDLYDADWGSDGSKGSKVAKAKDGADNEIAPARRGQLGEPKAKPATSRQ